MSTNTDDSTNTIKSLKFSIDPNQSYIGSIFGNNLHGPGFYIYQGEEKFFYDGLFYLNKLEGYSQTFYGNSSHFQGLFKTNRRFGPGVFTNPDGTQDVGLWMGFSLIRLGCRLDDVKIPQLHSSPTGKAKLLKFRYLVPVCEKPENIVSDLLNEFEPNENVLRKMQELYNPNVRNPDSLFFNKQLYDDAFFCNQSCTIELIDEGCKGSQTDATEEYSKLSKRLAYRIDLINSYLAVVEGLLTDIQKTKKIVKEKLEYCRSCCKYDTNQEELENGQMENVSSSLKSNGSTSDKVFQEVTSYKNVIELTDRHDDLHSFSFSSVDFPSTLNSADMDSNQKKSECELFQNYLNLSDICVCDEQISIQDLTALEQQMNSLIKNENYYSTILNYLLKKKERHEIARQQIISNANTEKVIVNSLLAWNNEEILMNMLKHSFQHRESEHMVTFEVADILAGRRENFSPKGHHEKACLNFLLECYHGNTENMMKYLREFKVNVNVTDSRGNSGVFFALLNKNTRVLKMLRELGANLNQKNDEGVTPLSLGLLLYLDIKYVSENWEEKFLSVKTSIQDNVCKWYSTSSQFQNFVTSSETKRKKNYSQRKSIRSIVELPKLYIFEATPHRDTRVDVEDKRCHLIKIEKILIDLLEFGINPNVTEVPLPALVMGIFTENGNIVKHLLKFDADPNITLHEGCLNAWHIVGGLDLNEENLDVAEILSKSKCNPNANADPNYLPEVMEFLKGNSSTTEEYSDNSMKPLHLLASRKDFLLDEENYAGKTAELLIEGGADPNATYLGLTPLAIVAIYGNQKLVEKLLSCKNVNPYHKLGYNMGNVLTVLGLVKYDKILKPKDTITMLDHLVSLNVNPLTTVDDSENAYQFLVRFHEIESIDQVSSKSNKKLNKMKATTNSSAVRHHLRDLCKKVLIDFLKKRAVKDLYSLSKANMLNDDQIKILAEYLTPSEATRILIQTFEGGTFSKRQFDKDTCIKVLQYIQEYQKRDKNGKKEELSPLDVKDMNSFIDFFLKKNVTDDPGKYQVCFYCIQGKDKQLVPCPTCHYIYYCSEKCYEKSIKEKTGHICPVTKSPFEKTAQKQSAMTLREKIIYAEQTTKKEILRKHQQQMEEGSSKEKEENKRDIYGMKSLQESTELQLFKNRRRTSTQQTIISFDMKFPAKYKEFSLKVSQWEKKMAREESMKELNVQQKLKKIEESEELEADRKNWKKKMPKPSKIMEKEKQSKDSKTIVKGKKALTEQKSGDKSKLKDKKIDFNKTSQKREDKSKLTGDAGRKCKMGHKSEEESDDQPTEKKGITRIKELKGEIEDKPYMYSIKAQKVPEKAQYFINLLNQHFPGIDFSNYLLPYACYADGHLYYHFQNGNYFCKNYSQM